MSHFFVAMLSSVRFSDVGSGPREEIPGAPLIFCILQPRFSSIFGATSNAAPPPTSIATLGDPFTLPINFMASDMYLESVLNSKPIFSFENLFS